MDLQTLRDKVEEAIFSALVLGDLSKLTIPQKTQLYKAVCDSVGLNPITKPFEYMNFQGREILYAGKNCAEQLRGRHNISIAIADRQKVDSLYIVTARATMPDGRHDESQGAIDLGNLTGLALANAIMKCETKAKRRVTLSIMGLGMLDESEVEDTPGALKVKDIEADKVARAFEWIYDLEAVPAEHRRQAVDYCQDNGAMWDGEKGGYVSSKRLPRLDRYQIKPEQKEAA